MPAADAARPTKIIRRKAYRMEGRLAPGDKVVIYAIVCEAYVKVGIAHNAESRLKEMQTGNPFPLRCTWRRRVRHEVAALAEFHAHNLLAGHHHQGEWFRCSASEARSAITRSVALAEREWRRDPDAEARHEARLSALSMAAKIAMSKTLEEPNTSQASVDDQQRTDWAVEY